MKVTLAKGSGFCFGVRDAVKMAYESSEQHGKVYMLGDIVHNEHVVKKLDDSGVEVVSGLDAIEDGPVLFRAHGTPSEVWRQAQESGLIVIDATCPLVTQIHDEVKELSKEGRRIIIIGDQGHEEVVGIASQAENPIIISKPSEVDLVPKMKRAGVVSQSTQTIENVQEILSLLVPLITDLRFINTICFPTRRNQNAIKELANSNQIMIIIGSFTSANTKRLTTISRELNPNTYQVQSAGDLKKDWFEGMESVGVSAGASTPDFIIDKVLDRINEIAVELEEKEIQTA